MELKDIKVGSTYRMRRYSARRLKDQTVVKYDPDYPMPGGLVRAHSGLTRNGYPSEPTTFAGDYFAEHADEEIVAESSNGQGTENDR